MPQAISRKNLELLENSGLQVKSLMHLLIHNTDGATLLHCSLGKDRTGLVFALLLLFLDVPEAFILKDYSLSTDGLQSCAGKVERFLADKVDNEHKARDLALKIVTAR